MKYFAQIITHYITTALSYAGAHVDIDTHSELNSALEEVIRLEERVTALEAEIKDINAYLNQKGWEQ